MKFHTFAQNFTSSLTIEAGEISPKNFSPRNIADLQRILYKFREIQQNLLLLLYIGTVL